MAQALPHPERKPPLSALSPLGLVLLVAALTIGAMIAAAALESSRVAAEAAAAGEESEFELEDMYRTWSWIALIGIFSGGILYGTRRGWAFASSVQISLIVVLLAAFLLIAQTEDRDFFRVGIPALIVFTLIQIAFGNIPPTASLRQSLIGLAITGVILAGVVLLSIWLVPSLIQLGR